MPALNQSVESLLRYSHLGLVMFVLALVGWFIGGKIDAYFGIAPTGETLGFFLGLAGGFVYLFLEVFQLQRELNEPTPDDENAD